MFDVCWFGVGLVYWLVWEGTFVAVDWLLNVGWTIVFVYVWLRFAFDCVALDWCYLGFRLLLVVMLVVCFVVYFLIVVWLWLIG